MSADRDRFWRWFALPLGVFLGVHFVLRLVFTPSLEPDDADLALFGQSLAWGYSDQGPLYSWMVWPLFQLFGVGVTALTVVRVAILLAIFGLIYRCTRMITGDQRAAILAAFSTLLVPTFIWHAIIYLTHTNLLCAVTLLTFYQFLRLRRSGSTWDYLLFGVVLGLGGLTKYNYVIAAVAFFGAGLMVPNYRRLLLDTRIGISVVVAGLMVLPHLLWLADHWSHITNLLARKTGVGHEVWGVQAVAFGLGQLAQNLVLIPMLLLVTFAWWFQRGLPRGERAAAGSLSGDGLALLEWFGAFVLCWFVLQSMVGGSSVHERWLQPYFILLPVYLFGRLSFVEIPPLRVRRYAQVLAVMAVGVTVARTTMVFVGGRDDGVYPLQLKFDGVAAELSPAVERADVIIAGDREIGGNLRVCFPAERTLCTGRPAYVPPDRGPERSVLLVWNTIYGDGVPPFMAEALNGYRYTVGGVGEVRYVELPGLLAGKRVNRLAYVEVILGDADTDVSGHVSR